MTTDTNDKKRQKVTESTSKNETNLNKPKLFKCNFIKPKNGKQCGLQVRKGQKFCFAHIKLANGEDNKEENDNGITKTKKNGEVIKRVPCIIDPSHTVWEDKLKLHVKVCNVLKKKLEIEEREKTVDWFKIDYNVIDAINSPSEIKEIDNDKWNKNIQKWSEKHDEIFSNEMELELNEIEFVDGLEERFAEVSNQKHIKQQSSLIGQLINHELLSKKESIKNPNIIIEFGCGRAEFARYLNRAMGTYLDDFKKIKYLLVDRDNPRLKFDNKIVKDIELCENTTERLKVDIKDLKLIESLKELNKDVDSSKFIGISKHLCGVATDLTLRCIENAIHDKCESDDIEFGGCLVAMCCRHCCKYEWLLKESKEFLNEKFGINETNFIYFKKMFAWATNGVMPGMDVNDGKDTHFSGLSFKEREVIGLKMRRILDESRKYAMEKKGFEVSLVRYVNREVSLENNCIIIRNKSV